MLNSLLKGKKHSKIVCVIVSPKNNSTDQAAVVLLPPNKDLPTGDVIKCLSSKVSKMTYSSLQDGAIEISPGLTCQWIYSWPYKKVMTTSHLLALQQAYPNPRTKQCNTECCQGFYQNFGAQSTSRASGLLVTPPNCTSHHHHYHKGFNKTATPLFSNIRNQLRSEAKMTTTHLGQPFVHVAMKLRGESNFFNIIDGSLFTYGGYTNFIHCDTRDHYSTSESKSIKYFVQSQPDERFAKLCQGI